MTSSTGIPQKTVHWALDGDSDVISELNGWLGSCLLGDHCSEILRVPVLPEGASVGERWLKTFEDYACSKSTKERASLNNGKGALWVSRLCVTKNQGRTELQRGMDGRYCELL
jgi:hypothetical protein